MPGRARDTAGRAPNRSQVVALTARRARSAERQPGRDLRTALGGFLTGTSRCAEAHPRRHCSA
eukprot:5706907-Prymnesium_polylepis.1